MSLLTGVFGCVVLSVSSALYVITNLNLTLQKLIMQKAADDLRAEAMAKAAEKEKYINDRVAPLKTDGLGECMCACQDYHCHHSYTT